MGSQIAVSFENGLAKIVYGLQKNGNLVVSRTLAVEDAEFDQFLVRERARDFTVVYSFRTFYQDVLLLPPVEEKYLDTLVEGEIRKNAPELASFTFYYSILKDKVHEGRPVREVFVFAADPAEVTGILERFSRYGKRVRNLYADVCVLARLIGSGSGGEDKTLIGVLDLEGHKTLFLVREGRLAFVRVIQARGKGIDQYDITNINMTVNHARQTLREHPSELVFMSTEGKAPEMIEKLSLPVLSLEYPPNIVTSPEGREEFVLPISGLLSAKRDDKENLLPQSYRGFVLQEKVLHLCTAFLVIASILCLGYLLSGLNQIRGIERLIEPLKAEIRGRAEAYGELEARKREFQALQPFVDYWNSETTTPNVQKAMVALQGVRREKVKIKEIEIKNDGRQLALQLKGGVGPSSYGELQSNFHTLVESVKGMEGVQLSSEKLDLVTRDFIIEAGWKP